MCIRDRGKTVTMKVLAEGFAQAGVPVFMADVKGDVTGMAQPGDDTEKAVSYTHLWQTASPKPSSTKRACSASMMALMTAQSSHHGPLTSSMRFCRHQALSLIHI